MRFTLVFIKPFSALVESTKNETLQKIIFYKRKLGWKNAEAKMEYILWLRQVRWRCHSNRSFQQPAHWMAGVDGYYNIVRDQFSECLLCFCCFGISTNVSATEFDYKIENKIYNKSLKAYILYYTVVTRINRKWNRLINVSGRLIYQDDHEPTTYNRICSNAFNESIKLFITIMTLEAISFVIATLGPFYSYIHYGEYVTIYSVRWPFLNQNPNLEYIVNMVWESIGSMIGICGLIAIEILFTIINNTITVSSMLCKHELDEISHHLEKNDSTEVKLRQKLLEILMKTNYMDE